MDRILAIDSGLTVTKAVVFDLDGCEIAVARRNVKQIEPVPRHVERDMADLWHQTALAIRDVLAHSATDPAGIVAVAATAHGDGLYVLDRAGQPLGRGVVSLDSRAVDVLDEWQLGSLPERALKLTGQMPHVSSPSALLLCAHCSCPIVQGLVMLLPMRSYRDGSHGGKYRVHGCQDANVFGRCARAVWLE